MNKITAIKEKIPMETVLPDGMYYGTWGGSIIDLRYKDKQYELTTDEGVRGMNIRVAVSIVKGIATFETVNN